MTTDRERYLTRLEALKTERKSWDTQYREIAEHLLPRRERFLQTDRNTGKKKHSKVINGSATKALRILAAGIMAGKTSPARPWFRFTTLDPDLAEFGPVKRWLSTVETRHRQAYARSNLYNALPILYADLPAFGTSPLLVDEDDDDVIRCYVLPVGQYYLANSPRLQIDTLYREISLTVAQVVEKFGYEAASTTVRDQYARGDYDQWVDIVHVIEPNRDRDPSREDAKGKKWRSAWMEKEGSAHDPLLRESGYSEFPVMAPRWSVTGEDVYGGCPGMDALGDIKELQLLERRQAQLVSKMANPPMKGPPSLKNNRASLLPGDITYVDKTEGGQSFEPAIVIHPQALMAVNSLIQERKDLIRSSFFSDLWLSVTEADGTMTATEINERREEKMLQLGPVIERLDDELLDPLTDRVFAILLRKGQIPRPPKELYGQPLRVEYISIMSAAQKMLGTVSIERVASFTGSLMAAFPQAGDVIDPDEMVQQFADAVGVKPDILRTEEDVAKLRASREQELQQQQKLEQGLAAAQGAKTLSETDLEGDSALNRLIGTTGGVASVAAGGGP